MEAVLAVERGLSFGDDPAPPLRAEFSEQFGHLSESELETLSDEDLRLYLSAANLVVFYSRASDDLARLEQGFRPLETRGRVSPLEFKMMFEAYIRLRAFGDAAALSARHPTMEHEPLPDFRNLQASIPGPSVLRLDADGAVSRVPAGLATVGPQVVVAAHPLCHFSADAVRAIEQDPLLAGLFAGHTLWLMPQDSYLNLDVVGEWNREHPDYEMRWAYQTSDWPMIKRWATPNFYFYRDGKLVTTVVGWPPEGQRDALLAAFKDIGVAPSATPDQRSR